MCTHWFLRMKLSTHMIKPYWLVYCERPKICIGNGKPSQSVPRVSILRLATTDSRDIYTFVLFPHFYDQTVLINNTAHCDDHSKPHKIPTITRGAMLSPTLIHWQICDCIHHTQSFNISFILIDLKAIRDLKRYCRFMRDLVGRTVWLVSDVVNVRDLLAAFFYTCTTLPLITSTEGYTIQLHSFLVDQWQSVNTTWWCHDTEMLSALPALCEENPPVTDRFHSQRVSYAQRWYFQWCQPGGGGGGGTAYVEVTMMCRSNGSLLGTPESLHMGTFLAKCP